MLSMLVTGATPKTTVPRRGVVWVAGVRARELVCQKRVRLWRQVGCHAKKQELRARYDEAVLEVDE